GTGLKATEHREHRECKEKNSFDMRGLPTAHFPSRFIKDSFVISLAHFVAGFRSQQLPERFILVVDAEIFLLVWRSDFVCAEEKTIRVTIHNRCGILSRFRRSDNVLGNFVPGDIEVDVDQLRIADDLFDHCGLLPDWPDDPPDADMGPNKRCVGMAFEQRFHLGCISRLSAGLCEWNVHVVVNENYQANFCGKVNQAIECRIPKTCDFARDFCGNEFLMNAEFTDAAENTRKGGKHTSNMIRGIHVRGIETSDHGIEPYLLFL